MFGFCLAVYCISDIIIGDNNFLFRPLPIFIINQLTVTGIFIYKQLYFFNGNCNITFPLNVIIVSFNMFTLTALTNRKVDFTILNQF